MSDATRRPAGATIPTRMSVLSEICTSFSQWRERPTRVTLSPRGWAKLALDCWPHSVDDREAIAWLGGVKCEPDAEVPDDEVHIHGADGRKDITFLWTGV